MSDIFFGIGTLTLAYILLKTTMSSQDLAATYKILKVPGLRQKWIIHFIRRQIGVFLGLLGVLFIIRGLM